MEDRFGREAAVQGVASGFRLPPESRPKAASSTAGRKGMIWPKADCRLLGPRAAERTLLLGWPSAALPVSVVRADAFVGGRRCSEESAIATGQTDHNESLRPTSARVRAPGFWLSRAP